MKVSVLNGTPSIFDDPTSARPFGFNRNHFEVIENHYDADRIFLNLDYLNCNQDFEVIRGLKEYEDNADRCVLWTMHDTPSCAYEDPRPLKFVCQPMRGKNENKKMRVISVPLQMRHFEYELIQDTDFIAECRRQKKVYDFVYIGQVRYASREWLKPENIKLASYLYRETTSIYHVMNVTERMNIIKKFCMEVAQARFCFCPRGIGSSSFRLYQSLMVGTIPIVSGMNDYPFRNELDWNSFCVIDDSHTVVSELRDTDTTSLRERGIEAWDKYFHMENTDKVLFEHFVCDG